MEALLTVNDFKKYFVIDHKGVINRHSVTVKAVDDITFSIQEGDTLGLVGESGSGKSTVAYVISGMYHPTAGTIKFRGLDLFPNKKERAPQLKKDIQLVFQDPGSSLNPKRNVLQILELPVSLHRPGVDKAREVLRLLSLVGFTSDYLYKYPDALSGGEKQIIAVTRALATEPSLIILDEPTSALDVSMQAKVITLLMDLQQQFKLTYLFITHDLSLMRNVANRVAIMYLGKICEIADTADFFRDPKHPYTQMLLSSIPVVSEEEEKSKPARIVSRGEIPSPVNIPPGCSFHLRCPYVMDICKNIDPRFSNVSPSHSVRCHLINGNSN